MKKNQGVLCQRIEFIVDSKLIFCGLAKEGRRTLLKIAFPDKIQQRLLSNKKMKLTAVLKSISVAEI